MPSDVPPSRTARLIKAANKTTKTDPTAKTVITRDEARELLQLYDELPNATVAAQEALKVANEKSTGIAFEKFRELEARLEAILARINAILG
jgi:hypothetical protein